MRYGFTTGSCAAAASKAAAYMLLTGREKREIRIITPKGIPFQADILAISRLETSVSCAVRKDGGDDPDMTTGSLIYAKVTLCREPGIVIDGGTGVGRVTRPGLNQPVGNAAINTVPRQMIRQELEDVCQALDYHGGFMVEISVPDGEHLAAQTFNPRLGIVGGISILGTSGIVEPMSSQALLDTIQVEINQKKAMGYEVLAVSPGNYGLDFMKQTYGYDLDQSVKCSNFIGETIDMAKKAGFTQMLLTGHIGKLIKTAGGIMNTHSREADARMELLAAFALLEYVDADRVRDILQCSNTEEAIGMIGDPAVRAKVMARIVEKIMYYVNRRAGESLHIECILYANAYGELGKSAGAETYLTQLKR